MDIHLADGSCFEIFKQIEITSPVIFITAYDQYALQAFKVAYNDKKVQADGPVFKSMKIKNGKAYLRFSTTGSGLMAKGGVPGGFAIAGSDGKFVWAKALIEGNQVVVWHEDILNPEFVRYAWADNPDRANLFNKEGLPAAPFRTDTSVVKIK